MKTKISAQDPLPIPPEGEGRHVPLPYKLAHVVFKTSRFKQMVDWYTQTIGARIAFKNDFLAFLTYDAEHHRFAIANIPGLVSPPSNATGIEHIALTYRSLEDLLVTYERAQKLGNTPFWCINHGTTLSMYFWDPDGNKVELQIDLLHTQEDIDRFFSTDFVTNPIGVDFDPAELLRRFHNGESTEELVRYRSIGSRTTFPQVHWQPESLPT